MADFTTAAAGLNLQFLFSQSVQILDYELADRINIIACKPAIQCIKADAIIIAVKDDLYMNQSGVGTVLSTAGRKSLIEDVLLLPADYLPVRFNLAGVSV